MEISIKSSRRISEIYLKFDGDETDDLNMSNNFTPHINKSPETDYKPNIPSNPSKGLLERHAENMRVLEEKRKKDLEEKAKKKAEKKDEKVEVEIEEDNTSDGIADSFKNIKV